MAETTTGLSRSASVYERVREELRQRCRQEAGTALPSLRQLSLELDANHLTITRALRDLESEGLLEVVPRKGTFIRANDLQTDNTNIELVTLFSQRPWMLNVSSHLLRGMESAASSGIIHATTLTVPPLPDVDLFLQTLRERRVGAVLFLGVNYLKYPDSLEEALFIHRVSQEMPVVVLGNPHPVVETDVVYSDPRMALQEYLEACRQKGLERYAFLGSYPYRTTGYEHFEVFKNFMLAHGIRWDERYVLNYSSAEWVRAEVEEFFENEPLPQVIIAADIIYLMAVAMTAQQRGLKLGKDIHVVTFSSIEAEVQHFLPDVSVILHEEIQVGKRAYELARERILNPTQQRKALTIRVPARIINNLDQ